ncbi:MAG: hypothetical protein K2X86_07230 [Cytophagaceae bacterium]|nr:hypothetical protein [Cytophagaceae bacterium]
MTRLLRISLVLCMLFMWGASFSQTQENYWVLSPKKVDFTGASPSGTNLPMTVSNATYVTANAAYKEDGSYFFIVRNDTIFNSSGTYVAKMLNRNGMSGRIYTDIQQEIAIAPVPGTCSDFYIIYIKYDMNTISGWGLLYTKVSVSGAGVVSVITNSQLVAEYSGDFGGIALSKYVGGISGRKLYAGGAANLDEYYVTSSGISWNRSIVALSTNNTRNMLELELNHAGTMLAWGSKNSANVYTVDISGSAPYSITTRAISGPVNVRGVEFNPAGTYVYASTNGGTAGVYKVNVSTGTTSLLSSSTN